MSEWDINIYNVGDPVQAIFGCCCPMCALAQARSNVDGSAFLFNFCCMNPFTLTWLIRSAYNIKQHSMKVDCALLCFIPCCYINQIYQTSARRGIPVQEGGADYNTQPIPGGICPTPYYCASSLLCSPCMMAHALDKYISMPYWRAFCCVSPCAGVNILRYHYRLDGSDYVDCFAGACCPLAVMKQGHIHKEVDRQGTNSNRYLVRTMMHARMVIDTQSNDAPGSPKGSPKNSGNKQKVSPMKALQVETRTAENA